MKPHKRNGKAARARRKELADNRKKVSEQFFAHMKDLTPEERLMIAIFGAWTKCEDCGNDTLIHTDCQSPHCKNLRGEKSVFYEEVTDDHIQIKGARMIAGLDY